MKIAWAGKAVEMRTIYTQGVVGDDGRLSVPLPQDVSRGEHRVIIVLEDEAVKPAQQPGRFPRRYQRGSSRRRRERR